MKILGKLNQAGKNENPDNQFCWIEIEKYFDEIIHQHYNENITQISSYEEDVFKFCSNQNFYYEDENSNQKAFVIEFKINFHSIVFN